MADCGLTHTAVLFDAHPLWLEAVAAVLSQNDVDVVAKATSTEQALVFLEEHQPDLLVCDISTPVGEMDGFAFLRRAREIVPEVKPVILSANADSQVAGRALEAGALAYVVKTVTSEDFAAAVRHAFDHSIYLVGVQVTAPPHAHFHANGNELPRLTRRELEILELVAEGLSNAQLARRVWVTEQTIKFHLSNIYRKLGVANRTEASYWALKHGLLPSKTSPLG